MPACEMCGKETSLFSAIIEGSQMRVCENCAKFGKVLRKPVSDLRVNVSVKKAEPVEALVENFGQIVRSAREKLGLTQKDFALKLTEKESVINKIESGSFSPPISLARKLEKILKIKLVEVEKEEEVSSESKRSGPMTIGDLIKIKK